MWWRTLCGSILRDGGANESSWRLSQGNVRDLTPDTMEICGRRSVFGQQDRFLLRGAERGRHQRSMRYLRSEEPHRISWSFLRNEPLK